MILIGTPKKTLKLTFWDYFKLGSHNPKYEYSNIFIDSPREFEIGVKIDSILPHNSNFEFFGCTPVARHGTITEFKIDYFEI